MKAIIKILICLFVLTDQLSFGQDIQYSQFYASPLYLNPAFAGTSEQHRFVGNFRDQWPSMPGSFVSFSLSYDYNLSEYNSGLGFTIQRDQAGSGGLSTTTIGGFYAYDIKINRKLAFRPAIGLAYGRRFVDLSKFTFTDQLQTGNSTSIQSNISSDKKEYMDISAGGVLYGNEFWVGYSVFHINQPNNSLLGQENTIKALHSVHVGYRFPLERTVKNKVSRSVTLAANYKAQGKWDQLDVGVYYFIEPFIMGIWYRGIPLLKSYEDSYKNHDAVILLVGVHFKQIRLGYSYDITISKLKGRTGGAHEVSLVYEYANPNKKRKKRLVTLACPKF